MSLVDTMLRIAAGRWTHAGRDDPYEEWSAELAAVRAEVGRLAALRFAVSLAIGQVPRSGSPAGARERLAGLRHVLGPVSVLVLAPTAGFLVASPVGLAVALFQDPTAEQSTTLQLLLTIAAIAGIAVPMAVMLLLGRGTGRRLPVVTATAPTHRAAATALATTALTGVGVVLLLAVYTGFGSALRQDPAGALGTTLGIAAWLLMLAALLWPVPAWLSAGHRWRVRIWSALGSVVAVEVGMLVATLPQILRAGNGLATLPLRLAAVIDPTMPMGPASELGWSMTGPVQSLPYMLFVATAFAVGYSAAASRPQPDAAPATAGMATTTEPALRRPLPWILAALGGLTWIYAAAYLAAGAWGGEGMDKYFQAGGRGDADEYERMLAWNMDIRRGALLLACCALVVAVYRRGSVLPVALAAPVLYVSDTLMSRWHASATALTLVATLVLIGTGAGVLLATRFTATPTGRRGRWLIPAMAILAAFCGPLVPFGAGEYASEPMRSTGLIVSYGLGAALLVLAAYCVILHRDPQPSGRGRLLLTVGPPAALLALGVLAAATGSPAMLILVDVVLGTVFAAGTMLLLAPLRRWSSVILMLVAVVAAVPAGVAAFLASAVIERVLPAFFTFHTLEMTSMVCGAVLVGSTLAVGHLVARSPRTRRARVAAPPPTDPGLVENPA
ncbi:MAG: hypothetical protein WCA46_21305, partial [Actinocatenispora sp.]